MRASANTSSPPPPPPPQELGAVGRKLNADKCKIQCSVRARGSIRLSSLLAGDLCFPVVDPGEGFSLLGAAFTLEGGTSREVKKRIDIAWGKFHQIWHLLRRRSASLRRRLRLFNAVVGRSFLWGAESWTLTAVEKRRIRSMQRAMLRRFAGPRRLPEEDFIPWIRRSTKIATEAATSAGVNCWVEDHLRSKWRWAGHLARMREYRPDSWAVKATFWRDSAWKADYGPGGRLFHVRPLRARAGRWNRWEDEIAEHYHRMHPGAWTDMANDKEAWNEMCSSFCVRRRS